MIRGDSVTNRLLLSGYRAARLLGVNPRATLKTVRHWRAFKQDLQTFRDLARSAQTQIPFGEMFPCLGESTGESGSAKGHYFHQDLLVARRIFQRQPARHIDIGSRIDGFVAHVAAFRRIEVLDIRPLSTAIPNVQFRQVDLMSLPDAYVGCTDSASCLHALEHFGLGRYGDRLDPDGHLKGIDGLHALVRPGGMLYLSTPIGPQRIEFNAHRVFSAEYLLGVLRPRFELTAMSYVDDAGDLHENVTLDAMALASNFGCQYGCGIFELRRN